MNSPSLYLLIALAPLAGAILAGLFGTGFLGRFVGRRASHLITIACVLVSFIGSVIVLFQVLDGHTYDGALYTWSVIGTTKLELGFLIDPLSALMMVVVTSVSLMVHIYTIGYMADDPGYQRFFAYISLFTFSMLMLVMSNNMVQLFFGWEAVGLVSYLLIGFWFKRPTAVFANLKAFLVNRVGDFGMLLGIAAVAYWFGTLDYATVFANAGPVLGGGQVIEIFDGHAWSVATLICILLFIGAMGKSAQVPLHVWLPDSMEGPTPISALIHAATMVTAGIFMVARMSPLFELSEVALQFILFIGATTAFFTGLIGIVQNDIKRVVAYSTLSQLGYMTVALGVSAYSAAVFHLMTHAFFKALLFLGAGSVIIAMHHEQDMRRMGGLRRYMPITFWTMVIGTLALVATPFFSGFYSKDTIIEAAKFGAEGMGWVGTYGYWAVLLGAFVTSFYSFRLLYLTFFGRERFRDAAPAHEDGHGKHDHETHHEPSNLDAYGHDDHGVHEPRESPWVVTLPLVLLAIPSIAIGFFTAGPMLFGTDWSGGEQVLPFFLGAIEVLPQHDTLARIASELWHGPVAFALHGFLTPAFWLTLAGFVLATVMYWWRPELAAKARRAFALPVKVLENKYWADDFWIGGLAGGSLQLGKASDLVDRRAIDGVAVNGTAGFIGLASRVLRRLQSGRLYDYAFTMIVGLIVLLAVLINHWT